LRGVIEAYAEPSVRLIGSSWGAMLGLLYTVGYPESVSKLILVGCAPLEEETAKDIMKTRLERLDEGRREEVKRLMEKLHVSGSDDSDEVFSRFGKLLMQADAYDPLVFNTEEIEFQAQTFQSVWTEARQMRNQGKFLDLARRIRCPVVAIHGDHDPHPFAGVHDPLMNTLKDFRSILLNRCGHLPWIERYAKEVFFHVLHQELGRKD
jgi:pimeloyl-ACP methyl ester carboxylesterase